MDTDITCVEREKNIYAQYHSVIAYFIAELEVRDAEYPIEIFNEIRAIFTHLSRYKLYGSMTDLASAERHVKRATLDCFKYMCISVKEEVKTFRWEYRKIDLSVADNGVFLLELNRLEDEADAKYLSAKKAEIKGNVTEDELYSMFEDAYNTYQELTQYLKDSREAILFASNHTKNRDVVTKVSIIVTIISIIVAIIFAVL